MLEADHLLCKALEALITTLRAHLVRLTSELSSHQQLLHELRSLRESDARTLREKSAEVERLREEVERLAGEVEVLRGVVEEGLNERRAVREVYAG
jgi:prefoldin subunit 5